MNHQASETQVVNTAEIWTKCRIALVFFSVALLSACLSNDTATIPAPVDLTPTPTDIQMPPNTPTVSIGTEIPIPTPAHVVLDDCVWIGKSVAWIDENLNGIQDEAESPLPSVRFQVDDVLNNDRRVGSGISNWNGEAELVVWLPGCPDAEFEIYPEIPSGYRLTTSRRLKELPNENKVYEFGFAYLPGAPTVTPCPPAPR